MSLYRNYDPEEDEADDFSFDLDSPIIKGEDPCPEIN